MGQDTARSVSKLLVAALSLIGLAFLVSLLPGIERLLPGTSVTLVALTGAVASLVVAGILLYAASGLAALVRLLLDGPKPLDEHVASIVHWLVVLAAVLVAHWGLAPVFVPALGEVAWIYDAAFLLLALPSIGVIAARLYVSLDPAAEEVADSLAQGEA